MARQIETPAPAADEAENDLTILHPDQELLVNGAKVTVREYSFIEGLQIRARHKPFLNALYDMLRVNALPPEAVLDVVAQYIDDVTELVALATGLPEADIRTLDAATGEYLLLVWWSVNGPFFVRGCLNRLRGEAAMTTLLGTAPTGVASTPS